MVSPSLERKHGRPHLALDISTSEYKDKMLQMIFCSFEALNEIPTILVDASRYSNNDPIGMRFCEPFNTVPLL